MTETLIRYAPGSLRVIVAGRGIVVLGEGATDAASLAIHDRLAAGEGFGAVVDALAAGGSLAHLPAFVVVVDEGAAWRVSVRGDLSAVVTAASGTETIDGSGASTWSERSILGVEQLSVVFRGADAAGAILPIAEGVVLASAVVVTASGASKTVTPSYVQPVAEPVSPAEPVQPHSVAEVRDEPTPAGSALPEEPAEPVDPVDAPLPVEPEPVEPAPSEPEPVEPAPVELEPVEPAPVEPEPVEPAPSEPEPVEAPAPVEPVQPHSVGEVNQSAAPAPVAAPPLPPVPAIPSLPRLPGSDNGMLIDSIPPFPRAGTPVAGAAPNSTPTDDEAARAVDDLEATTVVGRPLRERQSAPDAPDDVVELPQGDHDGETLSLAEARRLRAGGALPPPAPVAVALPAAAPLGRLRLSTGQIVLLDRTVIIGRRPGSSRASGADMPHLIGVDSPQQDISRNHVEVRAEGDSILVTDLQTTNGTTLLRQGSVPTRLHPGEATIVVDGDVLDLGDGVTVLIQAEQIHTGAIEPPTVETPA